MSKELRAGITMPALGVGVEAGTLFPTEALMAVLVCLGVSGHRFILSGTRIGFFSCLSSILCPVASKLSCSCPWEFDYHLHGETGRHFKKIHFQETASSLFLFPHRFFRQKVYGRQMSGSLDIKSSFCFSVFHPGVSTLGMGRSESERVRMG